MTQMVNLIHRKNNALLRIGYTCLTSSVILPAWIPWFPFEIFLLERRLFGNFPGLWHITYLEWQAIHFGQLLYNFSRNLSRCHLVLVIHQHLFSQPGLEHYVYLPSSHFEFQIFLQRQFGNEKQSSENVLTLLSLLSLNRPSVT